MHRNGFTLIEMVFVLSITLIMSGFSFLFHPIHIKTKNEIMLVCHCFDLAHAHALTQKEKVIIKVNSQSIDVTSSHYQDHLSLDRSYKFLTPHTFTYNKNGHIKGAKTIQLKTNEGSKRFVFQVGSGIYYVT